MTRRLRVLHVDPEQNWGGGEVQVLELSRYLHRAGHITHVATPSHGVLAQHLHQDGLSVVPLSIRNHLDAMAGWHLRRLVRKEHYDLVHFHTARAHALSPWLHKLEVQRIVTRRMDYGIKPGWFSHFLYGSQVNMVIAISAGVAKALHAAHIPDASIRVIPSGVNTDQFIPTAAQRARIRHKYQLDEITRVILMTGALVTRKAHHTLIEAASHIHHSQRHAEKRRPPVHYLICGDGPLRQELEDRVHTLGLSSLFHFTGFCTDLPAHLAAADLFVHVPVWEGLGVAVIEALAAGLPVVASGVGGIPELITDQETGLLIPAQDPSALCQAILTCLQRPGWAKTLGTRGQAHVRQSYDIGITAHANEALYYELLTTAADSQ